MSCCNRQNCAKQTTDTPAEPLLESVMGFDQITKLMEIARGGLEAGVRLHKTIIQNSAVRALAAQIADLAIENESLKSLLHSPVRVDIAGETAQVSFGTEAEYTLLVPIKNATERRVLRQQLLHAAEALAPSACTEGPQQQLLPFDN